MPRSNRPRRGGRSSSRREDGGPLDVDRAVGGFARRQEGEGGDWLVRPVSGPAATKTYRCPGCDQEIPPGRPHVVAWPADSVTGPQAGAHDRRHWHSACWAARSRRGALPSRPGRAPRY